MEIGIAVSAISWDAEPSAACSCRGSVVDLVERIGDHREQPPAMIFIGTATDNGPSNVTATWSRPPQPGIALLFAVQDVYHGEVPEAVVVHTPPGGPDGRPASGNCSVGAVEGRWLVAAFADPHGQLVAGACSMHPSPDIGVVETLAALLGEPVPAIANAPPQVLMAGIPRPPDPEDLPSRRVFEELDGQLDFGADRTVQAGDAGEAATGSDRDGSIVAMLAVVLAVVLMLIAVVLRRLNLARRRPARPGR